MKKFSALMICFLMILVCGLTGCATFSIDKVKYYNEVLATVGEENITRFELLSAYNSYGKNYYEVQQGKNESDALSDTLELLIDRESLYQYAKTDANYRPTAYQVNKIIKTMYESLDTQMASYITEAKEILDLNIKSDEDASTDSTNNDETAYLRKNNDYNNLENGLRRATLEVESIDYYTDEDKTEPSPANAVTDFYTTNYKIVYNPASFKEDINFDKIFELSVLNDFENSSIIEKIKSKYLQNFSKNLQNTEAEKAKKIEQKALSLFADDLMEYEYYLRDKNGKPYEKSTQGLIYRYFERTFESDIKTQYLTNIRTYYLQNHTDELSINDLVEEYKYLYTTSRAKYKNSPNQYMTDLKDIGTKGNTIMYRPELNGEARFGYFIHTLLNFDGLKEELDELKKLKDQQSEEKYNAEYNSLISGLTVKARGEDGNTLEDTVSLNDVLNEYDNIVSSDVSYQTKLDMFIDFMYKYTGDTATLSTGMPYVVGTNGYSAMEPAFTDEAVRLMTDGNPGDMTPSSTSNMCVTSYGIHLLFYIGEVDKFDLNNPDACYIEILDRDNNTNNLYTAELNPLTHETYFDNLFNAVYPAESTAEVYAKENGYSKHEDKLIKDSKKIYKVTRNETKIKATRTTL